jgi:hypothetical protein
MMLQSLFHSLFFFLAISVSAQTPSATSSTVVAATSPATSPTVTGTVPTTTGTATGTKKPGTSTSSASTSAPPDVLLHVPQLSVGRIELDVDNLQADINLNANVAQLVQINAGVQVGITKVNITIADVDAELELIVRLGHLVDIVNRVFKSLDLNPLLITALNDVTSVVDQVVGAVDGLLGSITQNGSKLSFLIDNLGNIVQEVVGSDGSVVSSIVGDYLTNMTFTGEVTQLANGDVQKVFSYSPLNALVDIVFNTVGQVVQAVVQGAGGSGGSGTKTSTAPASTATAKRR